MKRALAPRNGHGVRDRSRPAVTEQGQFQTRTVTAKNPRQLKEQQPISDRVTDFSRTTHVREIENTLFTPYRAQEFEKNRHYGHTVTDSGEQPALFPGPTPTPKPAPKSVDGMPAWLIRALENKTGGFRAAHWERCPRCQQIILTGLDADTAAFTVHADPTPITTKQEQLCHTIGRHTYLLQQLGPRIELTHRDTYSIGRPTRLGKLVPAHHCGARFPGFHHPHPATTGDHHDHPPF